MHYKNLKYRDKMSSKPKSKAFLSQNASLEQIHVIDRELKFKNALGRIVNPEQKVKDKRWYNTEWGYLYLTQAEYIKFLIKIARTEN